MMASVSINHAYITPTDTGETLDTKPRGSFLAGNTRGRAGETLDAS